MWRPALDQNLLTIISFGGTGQNSGERTHHIARQQAACISPRTAIGPAPKHNDTALVLRVAQDIVQRHGEAVQMTDVQRAKIVVERVVQQGIIDGEVHGLQTR